MKKNLLGLFAYRLLFLILALNANLICSEFVIPKNFVKCECEFKPIVRAGRRAKTHPHIPAHPGSSTNWAGYVAGTSLSQPTPGSVTQVYGSWVVPALCSLSGHTYSAIWIGIDGFNSSTVEQLGTEHEWVDGEQINYAWFEIYPNASLEFAGFPVNVGDYISAAVLYLGSNIFELVIVNNTQATYAVAPFAQTTLANAERVSAEWIVEAPYENGILPLADFGVAYFNGCEATINGVTGAINNSNWANESLMMVNNAGGLKASTSILFPGGIGFDVVWKSS